MQNEISWNDNTYLREKPKSVGEIYRNGVKRDKEE